MNLVKGLQRIGIFFIILCGAVLVIDGIQRSSEISIIGSGSRPHITIAIAPESPVVGIEATKKITGETGIGDE